MEINYHSKTDPIGNDDFPFKIGQNVEFVLKEQPKIDFQKIKKVIVYEGQVTSNGKDSFLGAVIKYYEVDGKFYDMSGNQISLPPEDYPNNR